MVRGIVDRIEGKYAVVEFNPPLVQPFCADILMDNFKCKVHAGDIVHIYSINGVDLTDDSRCVYKDINKADVLKKFLEPLRQLADCRIEVDIQETGERSEQMKSLISSLFNK